MIEPRHTISESTEITDRSDLIGIGAFFSATGWGTLIGTITLISGFFLTAAGELDAGELIGAVLLVGLIVGAFTLAGMVLIGLPITVVLRAIWWEPAWLYAALGTIAGFLIIATLLGLQSAAKPEFLTLAVSGALAGFAAGLRWGLWRENRSATRWQASSARKSRKRNNPIHDLVY